jgi:tripartite-type tricarboxylate transporter receptor subunit TctC
VLWNDLLAFWKQRPRHQWFAAVLAVLIPVGIVISFYVDGQTNLTPRRTIYYVESWPAVRADEQIKASMRNLGVEPAPSRPEAFADYIRAETAKWGKVVKQGNIKID